MKRILVITGGYVNIKKAKVLCNGFDEIIAADSGFSSAKRLGVTPNTIIGDFDSLEENIDVCANIIKAPAEKDDTDTMLACETAISHGANEIVIIGGTGGRADHFLANVFFLEALSDQNVHATLTDGENTLRIIENESVNVSSKGYFSVFALDSCTVSLSGCKYPLDEFTLTRTNPLAVSNEICGEYATVKIVGKAILCESVK